jgi:3'-5' exonuclease
MSNGPLVYLQERSSPPTSGFVSVSPNFTISWACFVLFTVALCYATRMPEQTVIVWDLETVPDIAAAARMLDLGATPEDEVREALGPGFPKHPLHKIVCIGALVASRQPEGWHVDALGAPHTGERSEADLIEAFADRVGQLRPQMVTWNGHAFDLPVLRYRAMVNRVSAEGLQARQYFHRFTEDAVDLCDVLGSYVPGVKVKLDEVTKILGLPGKPDGIDGSRVEEMVRGGQIEEVARYCESDVLNTYRVWLVYELFRGAITAEQLAWSEARDLQRTAGSFRRFLDRAKKAQHLGSKRPRFGPGIRHESAQAPEAVRSARRCHSAVRPFLAYFPPPGRQGRQ